MVGLAIFMAVIGVISCTASVLRLSPTDAKTNALQYLALVTQFRKSAAAFGAAFLCGASFLAGTLYEAHPTSPLKLEPIYRKTFKDEDIPSNGKTESTRTNSILRNNRYYSEKNKEELAARLDRISESINKLDEEALRPAELALLPRFLARPTAEARDNIEKLDQVETATQQFDLSLYGDMLANERDYREEINELLFPRDPLNDFVAAAKAYRTSIAVWVKLGNNIADQETSRSFREMVTASSSAFNKAKKGFVEWLSQRQELVRKARSELRS